MLSKFPELRKHHQLLFSLIILSGVICFWRGFWGLLDIILTPDNKLLSFILSLSVGIIILTITHYSIEKIV